MPTLLDLVCDGAGTAHIHTNWNGLSIVIQTPANGMRRGTDKDGNSWSQRIPFAYGEIRGTEGVDKEPVDVIIGDYLKSQSVFIVQLPKAKSGEDKVLIGFLTLDQAKKGFISNYGGDVAFLGKIKEVSIQKLKRLLKSRKGKNLFAMSGYDFDVSYRLTPIDPVPTGWNTKVNNPGDEPLTKEERAYNTEIARHQGPSFPNAYVQTQQVARTWSVENVYSMSAGGPGSGRHKETYGKISQLTTTGGPSNKGIHFTPEEREHLQQTVGKSSYQLHRGIGLIEWRVAPKYRDAVNSLKVGDKLPDFLKKGHVYDSNASYTKSKGVANAYSSGRVSIVTTATVPKDKVIVDLSNYEKLGPEAKKALGEDHDYYKSEKEVLVDDKDLEPIITKITGKLSKNAPYKDDK